MLILLVVVKHAKRAVVQSRNNLSFLYKINKELRFEKVKHATNKVYFKIVEFIIRKKLNIIKLNLYEYYNYIFQPAWGWNIKPYSKSKIVNVPVVREIFSYELKLRFKDRKWRFDQ